MPQAHALRNERITAIRFRTESTVDHVTARLLEAVRRTDLFLLTVTGDGNRVYPFEARNPTQSASSWCAELFWCEGASDMGSHLEVFRRRAELFLDCRDGVHVVPKGRRRRASRRHPRSRGAYGLDGAFGSVLDEPA